MQRSLQCQPVEVSVPAPVAVLTESLVDMIVVVGEEGRDAITAGARRLARSVKIVSSAAGVVESFHPSLVAGVVLTAGDEAVLVAQVKQIRRSALGLYVPIFLLQTVTSPFLEQLTDGFFRGAEPLATIHRNCTLLQDIPYSEHDAPLLKAFRFLWSRGERGIRPVKVPNPTSQLYSYPSAEVLSAAPNNEFVLIQEQIHCGVIERSGEAIDRLHHCPHCFSACLTFRERCPTCRSLDLEKLRHIHCSSCGHVEDARLVEKNGHKICTKCSSQLERIGVDFDYPLENYRCRACCQPLARPEVLAGCNHCRAQVPPARLLPRVVANYALSTSARILVLRSDFLTLAVDSKRVLETSISEAIRIEVAEWGQAQGDSEAEGRVTILALAEFEELATRLGVKSRDLIVHELLKALGATLIGEERLLIMSAGTFGLPYCRHTREHTLRAEIAEIIESFYQAHGTGLSVSQRTVSTSALTGGYVGQQYSAETNRGIGPTSVSS